MDKITLLRFVGDGTSLGANSTALEGEVGGSINESINKAVDIALQAAVVNTIHEGARKGHWAFQDEKAEVKVPALVEKPATISIAGEVPAPKEKQNELVQTQTKTQDAAKATSAPQQSNSGKSIEGNKEKSIWSRLQFWK